MSTEEFFSWILSIGAREPLREPAHLWLLDGAQAVRQCANRWLLTYSHRRWLCGADAAVVLHRRLDALISARLLRYTRNTRAKQLQSRPDPSGSAAAAAAVRDRRCAVRRSRWSGTAVSLKSERPGRACPPVPQGLKCQAAGRDSRAGHGADRLQAARAGRASAVVRSEGGEAGAPGGDLEAEI